MDLFKFLLLLMCARVGLSAEFKFIHSTDDWPSDQPVLYEIDTQTKELIIGFGCDYDRTNNSSEDQLELWPCNYLSRDFLQKINSSEIGLIGVVGLQNQKKATHLRHHYHCPVLSIYDNEATSLKTAILSDWISTKQINNIDLLCVDYFEDSFTVLKTFESFLALTKYIMVGVDETLFFCDDNFSQIKKYLTDEGFKNIGDGFGLFDCVLFINHRYPDLTDYLEIENFTINYNFPILLLNTGEENNSKLLLSSINCDHSFFSSSAMQQVDVNFHDLNGNTALMLAAAHDAHYPLEVLIQQTGLDFSKQNLNGCTALMIAAASGNTVLLHKIIDHPEGLKTINMVNNIGCDAEKIAELCRSFEIVEYIKFKKQGS